MEVDKASTDTSPKRWYLVSAPALAFGGVQLAWAVLIGHATGHLRKLGVSDGAVGLVWLAGPITGTFVQPVIGTLSDRSSNRFGKRRPFMLIGAILTMLGLVLFSNAAWLADKLGDGLSKGGGGSKAGLIIGIVTFWMTDFSINMLQMPARALLADCVSTGDLAVGSAWFAVGNGAGKAIGYCMGTLLPSIRETFLAAGLLVVLLTCVTVMVVDESADETEGRRGVFETILGCFKGVGGMCYVLRMAFLVQWFTYLGFMYVFIYGADWVGRDVFHGDGDSAPGSMGHGNFERGVRFGNAGLLGMAVCSMIFASVTPHATRTCGVRVIWSGSLFIWGITFVIGSAHMNRYVVLMMFIAAGFALSSAFCIPWTMAAAGDAQGRGVRIATFNLSQATPGVVAGVSGGFIAHVSGSLTGVMLAAGVCAIVASGIVMCVPQFEEPINDM